MAWAVLLLASAAGPAAAVTPVLSTVHPVRFPVEGGATVTIIGQGFQPHGSASHVAAAAVCRINSPLTGGTTFKHGGYACGKAVEGYAICSASSAASASACRKGIRLEGE